MNPYKSLNKNIIKHTVTEMYEGSLNDASAHSTIITTSFNAYTSAKYGLRLKVKYAAIKLVVTDTVLGNKFAVPNAFNIK